MAGGEIRPELVVEGKDDKHALIHLLKWHGIDHDDRPECPDVRAIDESAGLERGGVQALLEEIPVRVRLGTGSVVGFVLDADSPLHGRWQAVRDRLTRVDLQVPSDLDPAGFVADLPTYRTRVGIWLMPDNQHDGTLETFLEELIADGDPLIPHARSATTEARRLGAEFSDPDEKKAILHAWLAWQKEPGKPYGTAIRARYFQHDSPAALAFVQWFRRLYGIQ